MMGIRSDNGIADTSTSGTNFYSQSLTTSLSLSLHSLNSWMRLTVFISTTTKTTLQHRLTVNCQTHSVIKAKMWKFWKIKSRYFANHWSPIKIFAVLNSPRHRECRRTKISKIEASTVFWNFPIIRVGDVPLRVFLARGTISPTKSRFVYATDFQVWIHHKFLSGYGLLSSVVSVLS